MEIKGGVCFVGVTLGEELRMRRSEGYAHGSIYGYYGRGFGRYRACAERRMCYHVSIFGCKGRGLERCRACAERRGRGLRALGPRAESGGVQGGFGGDPKPPPQKAPHGGAAAEEAPGGAGEISAATERAGPGGGGEAETGDAADGKQHRAGGAEPAGLVQLHFQAAGAGAGAAGAGGGQEHRGETAGIHPGGDEALRAADAGAGAALGAAAGAAGAAPAGAAGQALSPKILGNHPKNPGNPKSQKIPKLPQKSPLNSVKFQLNSVKFPLNSIKPTQKFAIFFVCLTFWDFPEPPKSWEITPKIPGTKNSQKFPKFPQKSPLNSVKFPLNSVKPTQKFGFFFVCLTFWDFPEPPKSWEITPKILGTQNPKKSQNSPQNPR